MHRFIVIMIKCPRCGYENDSSSTYCVNCSYILSASPTGSKKGRSGIKTRNKVIIIIGLFIILFLVFSMIYDSTRPQNKEVLNVIEADQNVQNGSTHPYKINIIYDGSWSGRVGNPNYLQQESGYGNSVVSVDCVSWDKVYVDIGKTDYSSNNITVQILRNGDVVAENSTNSTNGKVVLSYQS